MGSVALIPDRRTSSRSFAFAVLFASSLAAAEPHWSFVAPEKVEPPAVKNAEWPTNTIDRFVLAKLEAQGLAPAPEAEPRALFRRLHLDVTGLPPKPEHVDEFVSDYAARGDDALSD